MRELAVSGVIAAAAFFFYWETGRVVKSGAKLARIDARLAGDHSSGRASYIVGPASRGWRRSALRARMIKPLERAGLGSPDTFLFYAAAFGSAEFVLIAVVFESLSASALVALLSLPALILWVRARIRARGELFAEQLPVMIRSLSSGLAAGLSLHQALENASHEAEPPASHELRALSEQTALGLSLDDALGELYRRFPLDDLNTLRLGLAIHRRSGGNMVELLDGLSKTIAEKRRLERNLLVETAQARMSAKVVGSLPVLVGAGVFLLDPSFIAPLFTTAPGIVMAFIAAALEVGGFLLLRRLAAIAV